MAVCEYASPLGTMLLASDNGMLVGAWFENAKYYASGLNDDCVDPNDPILIQTIRWLDAYFEARRPDPHALPIRLSGSEFRQAVLQLLLEIPYGRTVTYGQLAARLAEQTGRRVSAQAVGGAVGHNPISVVIPCHRVLGADGSLTGYAGGLERKQALLQLEML